MEFLPSIITDFGSHSRRETNEYMLSNYNAFPSIKVAKVTRYCNCNVWNGSVTMERRTMTSLHFCENNLMSFHFISGEDEMFFYIQSVHSGKYLDISGGSKEKGAQVVIYEFSGGKTQQWSYKKGRIVSRLNGCVIYKRLNISVSFPIPFFLNVTPFMKLNNIKTVKNLRISF